jgi:hypothetical protein
LTIASFFEVENGRIRAYRIVFDATQFDKLGAPGGDAGAAQ